jgi:hypothetical protein
MKERTIMEEDHFLCQQVREIHLPILQTTEEVSPTLPSKKRKRYHW